MSFDWQRSQVSFLRLRTHPLVLALVRGLLLVVSAMLAPVASASAFVVEIGIGAQGQSGCVVTRSGGVRCWGAQAFGLQLPGVPLPFSLPVDVPGLESGVAAVSVGSNHACVVTTAGGVKCWGSDGFGQLGRGGVLAGDLPADVFGLTGATRIAAGQSHSCAVTGAGGVKCWGHGLWGALGDGTNQDRNAPVEVVGLPEPMIDVAAGSYSTCAIGASGSLWCWGYNASGQLGNGTTAASSVPVAVTGLDGGVKAVALGYGEAFLGQPASESHACAVSASGGLACWGANAHGQLGDGTTSDGAMAKNVGALASDVVGDVALGNGRTCALLANRKAKCWGDNATGALGDGTYQPSTLPVAVAELGVGVTAIATGFGTTCAVTTLGEARCWGLNNFGQLGDATTASRIRPAPVVGLGYVRGSLAAGEALSCAVTAGGSARCWGRGDSGQIGDGDHTSRPSAVAVAGLSHDVAAIDSATKHACAVDVAGQAFCWGENSFGQLGDGTLASHATPGAVTSLVADVAQLALGWMHTCALTSVGAVKCWGANDRGQLGDGTTSPRPTAGDVVGLSAGVVAIAADAKSTCALTAAGEVKCWGDNANGQLGDGTTQDRLVPVTVEGIGDIQSVTVAMLHACALAVDGGVYCWGDNQVGQLGDGTSGDSLTPIAVVGLPDDVVGIDASGGHTCALTRTGEVSCWGWNAAGQLGDGTRTDRAVPVAPSGLPVGATAISAGGGHTCAAIDGGAVRCWGGNVFGSLGDGTQLDRLTPVVVRGLTADAQSLSAGENHTCLVTPSGTVRCWGGNAFGQLGVGTQLWMSDVPVDVAGTAAEMTRVSAGSTFSCALDEGGVVRCWGDNESGQLGDGTTVDRPEPADVSNLANLQIAVTTGEAHACALRVSGDVKCWGGNADGQLGDGTTIDRPVPQSLFPSGIVAIDAGRRHTCALTSDGGVKCWGSNDRGQLGDGTTANKGYPADVAGLSSGVLAISAGALNTCALTQDARVKCWGENSFGGVGDGTIVDRLVPTEVSGVSDVRAISVGDGHACALTDEDRVRCWGFNVRSQVGDGTTGDRLVAVDVVGLEEPVTAISAGGNHTCAAGASGGIRCWGFNFSGQLGDGSTTVRWTPVQVVDVGDRTRFAQVSAGGRHACAIAEDGRLDCWGANDFLQVGDGTSNRRASTVGVPGLDRGVADVATGGDHTCTVTDAGAVFCWGRNSDGQVGDGTTVNRAGLVPVHGLASGIVALAAGGLHSCALRSTGAVLCWGRNSSGQLGDSSGVNRLTPSSIVGLGSSVVAIAAGASHTCALTTGGAVYCWGLNNFGQVGDGTTVDKLAPVPVAGLNSGVVAIAAGALHTCALTNAGEAKCWGRGGSGQLGAGTPLTSSLTPVDVVELPSGVVALSSGGDRTCVLTSSGRVWCWGIKSQYPVEESTLSDGITAIGVGGGSLCAVTEAGRIVSCMALTERRFMPECGDGLRDFSEACDDGNRVDDDCCSSICRIEDGAGCDGAAEPVSPEGGFVATPDGGALLTIPPGALASSAPIEIEGRAESSFGLGVAIPVAITRFGPSGQTFATPVTVTLSWRDEDDDHNVDGAGPFLGSEKYLKIWHDGVAISGYCSDPQHTTGTCTTSCCEPAANRWTFQVSSFSELTLGLLPCADLVRARLTLGELQKPGESTLSLKGDVQMSASDLSRLDPLVDGLRISVGGTAGAAVELAVPGGAYDKIGRSGWKVNRARTSWTYTDARRTPPSPWSGVTKVVVKRSTRVQGLVSIGVKGKKGSFPTVLPLTAEVGLVPGACFDATPTCIPNRAGTALTCR